MKLSDYIFQRLAKEGVRHVFLLPGGGAMHLVDSLGKCKEIEFVCNLHEQACAIAADAYSQYTGNLGVALVTTGPGGTNTVTGVAGAWLDSTPCLFISGQVKRTDLIGDRGVRQMGFQELNIVHIVESITKYAVTVVDPNSIRYHLEKALFFARNGRPGPVWLDIPLDVQAAHINEDELEGFDPKEITTSLKNSVLKQQISELIQLLNQAERPVILVGNGVRLAKAIGDFYQLIETLQIPVLTTWRATDFLGEDHPLYIGRPGAIGQRGANFAQQNSDLILILGARLDLGQTGYSHSNFARTAKKIMVDVDNAEIEKMEFKIDIPICVDAKGFIREFLQQKNTTVVKDRSSWLSRCREWKSSYPVVLPNYWDESMGVSLYVLVDVLSDEMSADDLLVPGSSGACSEVTMQAFRVKPGMRVLNNPGLGAMGYGLPASIGACLGSGRKRTICVVGDGGFQLNIQELETIKRLNLPIKVFVLNNEGYASIRATQQSHFEGRFVASSVSSGLTLPDSLKIASAYGLASAQILNHSHITEHVRQVLEQDGPVVCDVMISPNQSTSPRLSSMQGANGTMVSKPLEDLWPFLDRKEFLANMIIPPLDE
ncbi:MAG: thiamine pyrophosphate-binding protein [Chloroflexi bacterium]|jgi:acetolactate synthase I/II/III large subunit|nr:thiamine pyrophosphate-binding protein [Chloroflexota bacterium]